MPLDADAPQQAESDASSESKPAPRSFRPQDFVLSMIGQYLEPMDAAVWSGGLVDTLSDFGSTPGASRVALTRLVNRALLTRVREGRRVFYVLSDAGHGVVARERLRLEAFSREARLIEQWTVVWHTIPEAARLERGLLARELRALGFGSPQDGTWLAPHDRERQAVALVKAANAEQHATILLGPTAPWANIDELIARTWDLDELARAYRSFVDTFARFAVAETAPIDDQAAFVALTQAVFEFQQLSSLDPNLPDVHLPRAAAEARMEAFTLFEALRRDLTIAARRHFARIVKLPT